MKAVFERLVKDFPDFHLEIGNESASNGLVRASTENGRIKVESILVPKLPVPASYLKSYSKSRLSKLIEKHEALPKATYYDKEDQTAFEAAIKLIAEARRLVKHSWHFPAAVAAAACEPDDMNLVFPMCGVDTDVASECVKLRLRGLTSKVVKVVNEVLAKGTVYQGSRTFDRLSWSDYHTETFQISGKMRKVRRKAVRFEIRSSSSTFKCAVTVKLRRMKPVTKIAPADVSSVDVRAGGYSILNFQYNKYEGESCVSPQNATNPDFVRDVNGFYAAISQFSENMSW